MTAPRERPIIFSAESVRGILAASELARDAREGAYCRAFSGREIIKNAP